MTHERPPSVDRLARDLAGAGFDDLPGPVLVGVAREAVALCPGNAAEEARTLAVSARRKLLQPVINATGVLIHTNLGRSPLPVGTDDCYTNLELDLSTGRRGDRSSHASTLFSALTGAEAATVVNNGAAALLLALASLTAGREVIVSRGEMIEIGGGFRIPEVLESSGAVLREVGTTNRTRLSDYERVIGPNTAAILKVHTSNYRVVGFTQTAGVRELAALAHRHDLPLIFDAGSGLLDEACQWLGGPPDWLRGEPAVRQSVEAGADLVTFSGDKLLGGPQAGLIVGRSPLVGACKRHPLARALRPGRMVLGSLQEVALSYLRRDAGETLPLWRMAAAGVDELRRRAGSLGCGEVVDCASVMGGGTLPGRTIPSVGVAIEGDITGPLRSCDPPVVARVEQGRTVCDLRTVAPAQDAALAKAVATVLAG